MEIRPLSPTSQDMASLFSPRMEGGETMRRTQRSATEEIKERNTQAARESESGRKAAAERQQAGPHIQFKDDQGARVMEVYDLKNVLIYQVPPKGLLMLIRNQESASSLETSA